LPASTTPRSPSTARSDTRRIRPSRRFFFGMRTAPLLLRQLRWVTEDGGGGRGGGEPGHWCGLAPEGGKGELL
jgi:hypothetical protein